jgi:hypothetical protein
MDDFSQKPNLRSKGTRMGIKSKNTIKYDVDSESKMKETTTFGVYDIDASAKSKIHGYYGKQPLSLNKDKRWEKLEEIKNDPNYIVVENVNHKKAKKKQWTDNHQLKESSSESEKEEEEGEFTVVQGRKGKQVKKKRTPGKKGVKKQPINEKPITEAKLVVEVSKQPTKEDGVLFREDDAGYISPDWMLGIEKNNQKKKRKKVKDQCNL